MTVLLAFSVLFNIIAVIFIVRYSLQVKKVLEQASTNEVLYSLVENLVRNTCRLETRIIMLEKKVFGELEE